MISIANMSGTLQVIPGRDGSKDLPAGATDSFEVAADNPHVQAKVRAGLIRIVEAEAEAVPAAATPEPQGEKAAANGDASARFRGQTKPVTADQPGGSTSTL